VRVVRETELDGVLEHDRGALTEMVEQRSGRAERRSERVGAWNGAALAQRLDQRCVRLELVLLFARHGPAQRREPLGESGRALERVLAGGQDVDRVDGVLRAL